MDSHQQISPALHSLETLIRLLPRAARQQAAEAILEIHQAIGGPAKSVSELDLWRDKRHRISGYQVRGTYSGSWGTLDLESAAEALGVEPRQLLREIRSHGTTSRRRKAQGSGDLETLTVVPVRFKKSSTTKSEVECEASEAPRPRKSTGSAKLARSGSPASIQVLSKPHSRGAGRP